MLALFAGGDRNGRTVRENLFPLTYERTFRNGPREVTTRYIEEEVPYGLVSYELLGALTGTPTPTISRMIDMFEVLRDGHYRARNTMADALGLKSKSAGSTQALFARGFCPAMA